MLHSVFKLIHYLHLYKLIFITLSIECDLILKVSIDYSIYNTLKSQKILIINLIYF